MQIRGFFLSGLTFFRLTLINTVTLLISVNFPGSELLPQQMLPESGPHGNEHVMSGARHAPALPEGLKRR